MSRLLHDVAEREAPLLEAHGLSLWEYVILTRLASRDGVTQRHLARLTRRDPTRLGANLDALSDRALINRDVDQNDRRRRLVRITTKGSELLRQVRGEITAMEEAVLGRVSTDLRSVLLAALSQIDAAGHDPSL